MSSTKVESSESGNPRRINLHVAAGIAVITVRQPSRMNAIDAEMWTDLTEVVRATSRDEKVRALILRGAGNHFSAGSDLKEFGRSTLPQVEDTFHQMEECAAGIEESPLPSVACIRGYALGTGLLLALACDLRIADNGATMGMPIARLGITLSELFVKRLSSLIGPARMKDLVYTGRLINTSEALQWGLANRVVNRDKSVLEESLRVADVICRQSAASTRAAMRWGGSSSGRVPATYNYVDPEDFPEGIRAFLERRPPRFQQSGVRENSPSNRS
jgi:enoyl-CoA hydratase